MSKLFLVLLSLIVGLLAPPALGNLAKGGIPTPPSEQQYIFIQESEEACQMIKGVRGVSECHVMDYPSFDVVIPRIKLDVAQAFCKDAAKSIASKFKSVSGKTWKVRVFFSGTVPPTASCRVPAFLG